MKSRVTNEHARACLTLTLTLTLTLKCAYVHHDLALNENRTLDAHKPRNEVGDRYPALTCMPCAEISSYEPPTAACPILTLTLTLTLKFACVHDDLPLNANRTLDAHEPRILGSVIDTQH